GPSPPGEGSDGAGDSFNARPRRRQARLWPAAAAHGSTQARRGMVMGLWGLRAKFFQDPFTQKIGIVLARLGKFDDAPRDNFVGEIAPVRKAKGRASHFDCHPHDALGLGVERHSVQVGSYRHGALLQSQAGARPVSQPSAPDRGLLPMIEPSYAALHARRVPYPTHRTKINRQN